MDKVRKQMAMTLQAGTVDRVRVGAFYSNLVLFFLDYGRIVDVNTMIPPVGFRLIYQLTRMTNALRKFHFGSLINSDHVFICTS